MSIELGIREKTDLMLFSMRKAISENQKMFSEKASVSTKFQQACAHISIEKIFNSFYDLHFQNLNIVLISKASMGFGDVIWGARACESLIDFFPNIHISIISDGVDKFEKLLDSSFEKRQISFIPSEDDRIENLLTSCDLIIDGPYPIGRSMLREKKEISEDKIIDFIEYDRGDYISSWHEEKMPSQFLSGIGENAYGIYTVKELVDYKPLSSLGKKHLLDQFQDTKFLQIFKRFFPNIDNPLYLGYAHSHREAFLETVIRYEDLQDSDKDVVIVLLGNECDFEKLISSFKEKPVKSISSIHSINLHSRLTENFSEIKDLLTRLEINEDDFLAQRRKHNAIIPYGEDFILNNNKIIEFSHQGRKIHIILYPNLKHNDMAIMHRLSEKISLGTGDQTLSELITMRKFILYDSRKVSSINWMIELAMRNDLNMMADYLKAFTHEKNISKVVELLANPRLEIEKNQLCEICMQKNLALSIQQIVSRRIFHQKTNHILFDMEKRIHEVCERLINDTQENDSMLFAQMNLFIKTLNKLKQSIS